MELLPEDVLSEILSRTSPMEALKFTAISKGIKSAADSDSVWDRFLLSDLPEILSRTVSALNFATKKELYLSLCRTPILLDEGILSFCLEKASGKKCYMVGARGLRILWANWISHPDSRFSEVAKLEEVRWLKVSGCINTRLLSSKTIYGAYLVFKLDEVESANALVRFVDDKIEGSDARTTIFNHFILNQFSANGLKKATALLRLQLENASGQQPLGVYRGLESANGLVRFVEDKIEGSDPRTAILDHFKASRDSRVAESVPVRRGDGLKKAGALLHLQPANGSGQQPVRRADGWMEVEMGSFYNDRGDEGDVEAKLLGVEALSWKYGLIVEGIEFRPKP